MHCDWTGILSFHKKGKDTPGERANPQPPPKDHCLELFSNTFRTPVTTLGPVHQVSQLAEECTLRRRSSNACGLCRMHHKTTKRSIHYPMPGPCTGAEGATQGTMAVSRLWGA